MGKKNISYRKNDKLRKGAILAFWLVVWFVLAAVVDNGILLANPLETAERMVSFMGKPDFYVTVGGSLLRIGTGFLAGFLTGLVLAAAGSRFVFLEEILSPVMALLKAVPVASFVVLLLIWWGSSFLAVAVCFLVVLPNIYINTLEGLKNTDRQLLEMAQVFRLPFWNRLFYIYRPGLKPFLYSGMKISLGMCWKSGVAAEVIGTPDYSIGERLYLSKLYLDTAGVLAWTAVIILLSICFEKLILYLTDCFFAWEPACRRQRAAGEGGQAGSLTLAGIHKEFDGQEVLREFSAVYEAGGTYFLTGPSGSGKTTLMRILAGLLSPDSGQAEIPFACSMVFQEDRLCEDYSAVRNVELVTGDRAGAEASLGRLLEKEALHRPCRLLSGGMRRRVALVRALEAESAYLLLDEPFTGMDRETRLRAERYVRERQKGRTLVIASHR